MAQSIPLEGPEKRSETSSTSQSLNGTSQDPASKHTPDILQRARRLQCEIESLHYHIQQAKARVPMRSFLTQVRSELSILESRAESGKLSGPGNVPGTNMPHLETVWRAAKCSKGLVGFSQRMFWEPPRRGKSRKGTGKDASNVVVDIVAEDGAKWIKVSTITPKRLMYEMAEKGLASEDLLEMQNDSKGLFDNSITKGLPNSYTVDSHEDDDDKLNIVKMAEALAKAARATRVKYKHPTIQLILPRLASGKGEEIDVILHQIRKIGIDVDCRNDVPEIPLDISLRNGLLEWPKEMSETLNIDCNILLALISDISHTNSLDEPWFNREIQRQVESEDQQNLLPSIIYPILNSHPLVCTDTAAARMRKIVEEIPATSSEKKRAEILMGDDPSQSPQQRIQAWAELTCHEAPKALELPVRIVESRDYHSTLSPMAQAVMERLNQADAHPVTISVLTYGWASRQTTITSNRVAVRAIRKAFDEQPAGQEMQGPDIWLCPISRSLVGKEMDKGPLHLRPPGRSTGGGQNSGHTPVY